MALSNYDIRSDATIETPTTNQNIKFIKENDHLFEIENAQIFIYLLFYIACKYQILSGQNVYYSKSNKGFFEKCPSFFKDFHATIMNGCDYQGKISLEVSNLIHYTLIMIKAQLSSAKRFTYLKKDGLKKQFSLW